MMSDQIDIQEHHNQYQEQGGCNIGDERRPCTAIGHDKTIQQP
jgi:hypothetical protein